MTVEICPHCIQRYSRAKHSGDYIHTCPSTASPVLRQEDIVVIESISTEFGSNVNTDRKPGEIMKQGISNKLQGTFAGIQGAYFGEVTIRGNNAQTHRSRQHYQYIESMDDTK